MSVRMHIPRSLKRFKYLYDMLSAFLGGGSLKIGIRKLRIPESMHFLKESGDEINEFIRERIYPLYESESLLVGVVQYTYDGENAEMRMWYSSLASNEHKSSLASKISPEVFVQDPGDLSVLDVEGLHVCYVFSEMKRILEGGLRPRFKSFRDFVIEHLDYRIFLRDRDLYDRLLKGLSSSITDLAEKLGARFSSEILKAVYGNKIVREVLRSAVTLRDDEIRKFLEDVVHEMLVRALSGRKDDIIFTCDVPLSGDDRKSRREVRPVAARYEFFSCKETEHWVVGTLCRDPRNKLKVCLRIPLVTDVSIPSDPLIVLSVYPLDVRSSMFRNYEHMLIVIRPIFSGESIEHARSRCEHVVGSEINRINDTLRRRYDTTFAEAVLTHYEVITISGVPRRRAREKVYKTPLSLEAMNIKQRLKERLRARRSIF
ncbi:MAG: hypothetical protein ACTSXJ_08385 [Candidatus Baldrarchaeia archaeon]